MPAPLVLFGHSFVLGLGHHFHDTLPQHPAGINAAIASILETDHHVSQVYIFGESGATFDTIAIADELAVIRPDIQILELGTNDMAQYKFSDEDIDCLASKAVEMADILIMDHSTKHVVICLCIKRYRGLKGGQTVSEFMDNIYKYNRQTKSLCSSRSDISYHIHSRFWAGLTGPFYHILC